jgi:hypothetical protein
MAKNPENTKMVTIPVIGDGGMSGSFLDFQPCATLLIQKRLSIASR